MATIFDHARLEDLVNWLLEGHIDVDMFCTGYERAFSESGELKRMSPRERAAHEQLFSKVVWYSPFPDERQAFPRYLGDDDIVEAARAARKLLKISRPGDT